MHGIFFSTGQSLTPKGHTVQSN